MAIVKNVSVLLKDGVANTDQSLYFYKGDVGVLLDISFTNLKISIVKSFSFYDLNLFSSVDVAIVKPNNQIFVIKDVPVINGNIRLELTKDMTDCVGEYNCQVRLKDVDSKLTLPQYKYDVREPIAIYE